MEPQDGRPLLHMGCPQDLLDSAVAAFIKQEPQDAAEERGSGDIGAVDYDVVTYLDVTLESSSDDEQLCGSDAEPSRCAAHHVDECRECSLSLPFTCTICRRGFRSYRSLLVHSKLHTRRRGATDRPECAVCNKRLDARRLPRHFSRHHAERAFVCRCGAAYASKAQLDEHARSHSADKPFPCHLCGQRFDQHAQLKAHYRSHSLECLYACSICDEQFASLTDLSRHISTHKRRAAND